jgi:hypothetical protein
MRARSFLKLAVALCVPSFSMDHRVKPGGDQQEGARGNYLGQTHIPSGVKTALRPVCRTHHHSR